MNGASGPGPRVEAFVDWTIRWGKWLWIATLVLAIPATWRGMLAQKELIERFADRLLAIAMLG